MSRTNRADVAQACGHETLLVPESFWSDASQGVASMDGARPSRFPHLSWLGYRFSSPAESGACCWNLNGHAHALHMVFSGPHRVRWISRGRETSYSVQAGSFHYLPADDESHTIVASPVGAIRSYTLFVPPQHITEVAAADHHGNRVELHRLLVHDDPVLQTCLSQLAATGSVEEAADARAEADEAARMLVLRLIQLGGGGTPDWHSDDSIFTWRTLQHLVSYIDEHLRISPSVADMSFLVGLSPSHFAKKFRKTTGLSLHRFINRRRIVAAMDLLKDQSQSLAHVALDLGFSSQSHFTHLFSNVTCMTPAKYQKQFKRTVG